MQRTERIGTAVLALPRTGLSWPLLIAAVAFIVLAGRPELLRDPDSYWHIATGRWIFEHGTVPVVDVFSYTLQGSPWTAHEWLSEVVLAGTFNLAGWTGVVSLTAAAIALAFAMLARFLLRYLQPVHMLIVAALSAGLLAPHLLARPHILVAPIMVAWSIGIAEARERESAPPWWFALLIVLWANMHASFLIGLALAGAFAIEAVLAAPSFTLRRRAARDWGLFLALLLAAALCTPFGVQSLLYPVQVNSMNYALAILNEWRSPDFHTFSPWNCGCSSAAALSYCVVSVCRRSGLRYCSSLCTLR